MSETKKITKEAVVAAKVEKVAEAKAAKVVETPVKVVEEKTVKAVEEKVVKAPAKKAPAKKTTTAAKNTTKEVKEVSEFFIQYGSKEVTKSEIEAKVKAAWMNETGKKESAIKTLKVYVKPEENTAYYVINENNLGHVGL